MGVRKLEARSFSNERPEMNKSTDIFKSIEAKTGPVVKKEIYARISEITVNEI